MFSTPAVTKLHSEFRKGLVKSPFTKSKLAWDMYHVSPVAGIDRFNRVPCVWVAEYPDYYLRVFGENSEVYPCYVESVNPYYPTEEECELLYADDAAHVSFFAALIEQGYDSFVQGMESGSVAVFPNARIVDARTLKEM